MNHGGYERKVICRERTMVSSLRSGSLQYRLGELIRHWGARSTRLKFFG
jgi:hypothetical protein